MKLESKPGKGCHALVVLHPDGEFDGSISVEAEVNCERCETCEIFPGVGEPASVASQFTKDIQDFLAPQCRELDDPDNIPQGHFPSVKAS